MININIQQTAYVPNTPSLTTFVKAEEAIAIVLEDKDQVIKGQIDLPVVQDALWIVVIEAKHSAFNVMVALPQILTYMSVSSQENQPVFGLITNGSDFRCC